MLHPEFERAEFGNDGVDSDREHLARLRLVDGGELDFEQAGLFQMRVCFHCTLETTAMRHLISPERRITSGVGAFVDFISLLSYKSYRPDLWETEKRLQ